MNSIDFPFDDIPVLLAGSEELAIRATGKAEISYSLDGEWHVSRIYLDCYDTKAKKWSTAPYELSQDGTEGGIWHCIHRRLTEDLADSIDEAVAEDRYQEMPWPAYSSVAAE